MQQGSGCQIKALWPGGPIPLIISKRAKFAFCCLSNISPCPCLPFGLIFALRASCGFSGFGRVEMLAFEYYRFHDKSITHHLMQWFFDCIRACPMSSPIIKFLMRKKACFRQWQKCSVTSPRKSVTAETGRIPIFSNNTFKAVRVI